MTEQLENTARRLADGGREALVARLREAYAQAARRHSDILAVSDERLEELVQRSADRADGLQWRRALADVACEELGIGLAEALHHPAVARAQEMVGAPSYEESLGALATPRTDPTGGEPQPAADREEDGEDKVGAGDEAPPEPRVRADREAPSRRRSPSRPKPTPASEAIPASEAMPTSEADGELRVAAIHLGGVANLPTDTSPIDVRLSADGLDIIRNETEIVGRLGWSDIETLEVPTGRGRRRRRGEQARLVVRTPGGDASFEVPRFTSEELRERLDPIVARYSRD